MDENQLKMKVRWRSHSEKVALIECIRKTEQQMYQMGVTDILTF